MKRAIFGDTENKFTYFVQNVTAATGVPIVDFRGEVGSNGLQVELLGFVDVVDVGGSLSLWLSGLNH